MDIESSSGQYAATARASNQQMHVFAQDKQTSEYSACDDRHELRLCSGWSTCLTDACIHESHDVRVLVCEYGAERASPKSLMQAAQDGSGQTGTSTASVAAQDGSRQTGTSTASMAAQDVSGQIGTSTASATVPCHLAIGPVDTLSTDATAASLQPPTKKHGTCAGDR